MKHTQIARRTPSISSGLILIHLLGATGCTHIAAKRAHTHANLEEHSRALTTAVVDTLQLQPSAHRDPYTEFALRVAREDQRIQGLPLDSIPVEPFLTTHLANPLPKLQAERTLTARFAEIEKLLAAEKKQTDRLLDFGAAREQIQNRSRTRWAKWLGSGTFLLGAVISLCIFFPAAIPILGRILGWLVSKIPALAGAIGVVSVQAFDAVVKGIERTKSNPSPNPPSGLANHYQTNTAEPSPDPLHLNLSREMDAAHKALVRSRKTTLP